MNGVNEKKKKKQKEEEAVAAASVRILTLLNSTIHPEHACSQNT